MAPLSTDDRLNGVGIAPMTFCLFHLVAFIRDGMVDLDALLKLPIHEQNRYNTVR
ncbi:hypothetical protein [Novipirellula herctigrandis]|uniref:hypothetical protein n=1 Tax=Novipirellula herctigrandis TaxID=2527986 RepID=UPI003AF3BE0B